MSTSDVHHSVTVSDVEAGCTVTNGLIRLVMWNGEVCLFSPSAVRALAELLDGAVLD